MERQGDLVADRYELVQVAGEGGMGTVWRGVIRGAAGFSRPVAVKRIHRHLAGSTEQVRMFIEEARVVAGLQHPNIVQVHDFGVDSGGYYLVMEWVEGLDLLAWLDGQRRMDPKVPWRLVAAVGAGVSGALTAAHSRETEEGEQAPVFHRDVTPQNIMMGLHGVVMLTDFGLARAMDRARMTAPDVVKGKLSYLAPEMTHGHSASAFTDIFSLGIVLWEALSGHRLFDGESDMDRILNVRRAEVPPLQQFRQDLPEGLIVLVHACLAREPEGRPADASVIQQALLRVLGTEPVTSQEIGRSVRAARQALGLQTSGKPASDQSSVNPRGTARDLPSAKPVVARGAIKVGGTIKVE